MGSAIARLAVGAGMEVIVSNSRGPESLADLVAELGPSASAGTAEEAIRDSDAVVLSVPLLAVRDIPVDQLGEKLILDTSNYYPYRDGRVPVLDDNSLTTGELVRRTARHCPSRPTIPRPVGKRRRSSTGSASMSSTQATLRRRGGLSRNPLVTRGSTWRMKRPRMSS